MSYPREKTLRNHGASLRKRRGRCNSGRKVKQHGFRLPELLFFKHFSGHSRFSGNVVQSIWARQIRPVARLRAVPKKSQFLPFLTGPSSRWTAREHGTCKRSRHFRGNERSFHSVQPCNVNRVCFRRTALTQEVFLELLLLPAGLMVFITSLTKARHRGSVC